MEKKEEDKIEERKDIFDFKIYIAAGVVILSIVVGSFIGNFGDDKIPHDVGKWGSFGDYLGGTLNPIFAFLSFIALLYTINLQSKELSASRKELELTREELSRSADAQKEQSKSIKLQSFETTFFNMISLHNENIKYLILKEDSYQMIDSKSTSFEGAQRQHLQITVHRNFYIKSFLSDLLKDKDYVAKEVFRILIKVFEEYQNKKGWEHHSKNYDDFYEEYNYLVTHYFRHINQIFIFIDGTTSDLKKKYIDIFKAQFSNDELKLILYHLLGINNIDKLKSYIEEHSFFEFLNYDEKFISLSIENIEINAFKNNKVFLDEIEKKIKTFEREIKPSPSSPKPQ